LLQSHQAPMAVDQEHIWFEPDKVRCCTSDAVVVAGVPAASDYKVAPSGLMRPTTPSPSNSATTAPTQLKVV
jgi:hypothetical protein